MARARRHWVLCQPVFHPCDKIPETISLKETGFNLVLSFNPRLMGSIKVEIEEKGKIGCFIMYYVLCYGSHHEERRRARVCIYCFYLHSLWALAHGMALPTFQFSLPVPHTNHLWKLPYRNTKRYALLTS